MLISVCIPMYNESAVIEKSALALSSQLEKDLPGRYELIFCDDGSTDGCADIVKSLNLPSSKVIRYEQNRGKGYAVRKAMSESSGDLCFFTDADLAYGTEVIVKFAEAFEKNPDAELFLGSRNIGDEGYKAYPFVRRVASKIYIRVLNLVGGFRISDSQCGCKAFTRKAVDNIFPKCEVDRFAFDYEIILFAKKLGYKNVEIPVSVQSFGESKVHVVRDTFRMLSDLRKMKKRINRAE